MSYKIGVKFVIKILLTCYAIKVKISPTFPPHPLPLFSNEIIKGPLTIHAAGI